MKRLFFLLFMNLISVLPMYGMESIDASPSEEQKVTPNFGILTSDDPVLSEIYDTLVKNTPSTERYDHTSTGCGKAHSALCVFFHCFGNNSSTDFQIETAKTLIEKGYVDNLVGNGGESPFFLPIMSGVQSLVQCFIDRCPNNTQRLLYRKLTLRACDKVWTVTPLEMVVMRELNFFKEGNFGFLDWFLSLYEKFPLSKTTINQMFREIEENNQTIPAQHRQTLRGYLNQKVEETLTSLFKLATGPTNDGAPSLVRILPRELQQRVFEYIIERPLKRSSKAISSADSQPATADNT